MRTLLTKIWLTLRAPDRAFDTYLDESPRETILLLLGLSTWLAFMTAITNLLGIPCNLLNSGTNPQLFAYHDIAPLIEQSTGIPRWLGMFPLVLALSMLFVPIVSVFYHVVFKALGGKGSYWHTFRFFVYAGVPVFLLGWVPYIGGTVAAFWTAALYPLALTRLHRFSWGLSALFVGVLMGIQIGRIFLTGEWYGVPVR